MSKIRLGILGGGGDSLIGVLHRVASYMYDRYEIVGGVFNPDYEENIKFAKKISVNTDRVYKDFDAFVAEESAKPEGEKVEVVSVLTPNFLHYPMAKKLLENGFHVICEKPLTTTLEEAKELQALQKKHQAIFAVTYTYRLSHGERNERHDRQWYYWRYPQGGFTILSGMDKPSDSRQRRKE